MNQPSSATDETPRSDTRLALRFALVFGALAVLFVIFLAIIGTEWRDSVKNVLTKGKTLRALHYGQWGVWWGCAADAVLCAVLALTSRWWAAAPPSRNAAPSAPRPISRNAWLGLLAIIVVAGALRWERAGLSFYNDEAQAFRRYIGGQHLPQKDGTVKWHEPPWWESAWLNKAANNSMPFSLLGRFSYDVWSRSSGQPTDHVSERAVRLPIFLGATIGLIVLWLVMRRMLPGTSACWWVLILAALHPWHVRYSSEARGHGLLLLGVPLCLWFLQRALEDDRWRWWIGMGLAQFFCVWSFQGCAAWLVVFNGLLLAVMTWQAWRGRESWRRLSRPVLGMTVGAIVTLPVMLPLMKQLAEAIPMLHALKGPMGLDWWQDVLSLMLAGIAWVDRDPANPQNLALARVITTHPWLWCLAPCILAAVIWGARHITRSGLPGLLAAIAAPIAAFGMWASLSQKGVFMYPWYLIFILPGLLIAWAGGITTFTSGARSPAVRATMLAVMLLPIVGLAWLDRHIITVPKEDLRGLARAIPGDAIHGSLFSDVDVYDAEVVVLKNMTNLDTLIAAARARQKPLYISFSRRDLQPPSQAIYQRLETSPEFEHIADFPGQQDPQFTHHLHRLRQ